ADNGMIFVPQTDLAILNYLCNYLIQNGRVNREFVEQHVNFKVGATDIGYGLRPNDPREQSATSNGYPGADGKPKGDPGAATPATFEEFAAFVSTYTLDYTARLSGVPAEKLQRLAELYADPDKKVVSFWTMGFNQHARGT